jgi:DNA-directed RNA polymerase II subunit RPB1
LATRRELNNAKLNDDYFPMPVNIGRVLSFVRSIHIDCKERMTDKEIYNEILNLNNRISDIFIPCSEITGSEKFRSLNATKLFRIYMFSELATMKIRDLNKSQILYVIQDIEVKFKKAIVNAGEMCGILAAQSIGELTTQMTLNSFHYAGVSAKNITLGVPRLKELINVTKKLKTPSLTMYEKGLVKDLGTTGQKRIVEGIRSSLEYKTLQDIIKSSDIVYSNDEEYANDNNIIQIYKDLYEYTDSPFPENFLSLRLQFSSKELEYVDTSLFEISKLLEKSIGNGHKIICSDDNTIINGKENLFIRVICGDANDENEKEQMTTLRKIEVFCMSVKIKGCEGIDRVFTRESKINKWTPEKGHYKESQWILETEGSNLVETMTITSIDHTKTISNNVIEIYEVFGIEAARQSLLNELRTVLSFDGSYVNYRHLAILVDTMTCRGSLTAMTRHGINRVADAGTLTKCSFEETVEVLTDAAAFGEIDTLKGISDNIMLGQTIPAGTGVMDIIYDTEMEPDIKVPAISREPTPMIILDIYIPSEPDYDPMSIWPY